MMLSALQWKSSRRLQQPAQGCSAGFATAARSTEAHRGVGRTQGCARSARPGHAAGRQGTVRGTVRGPGRSLGLTGERAAHCPGDGRSRCGSIANRCLSPGPNPASLPETGRRPFAVVALASISLFLFHSFDFQGTSPSLAQHERNLAETVRGRKNDPVKKPKIRLASCLAVSLISRPLGEQVLAMTG